MLRRKIALAVVFGLAAEIAAASGVSVLFVGNSLTYRNDLPTTFKKLAVSSSLHIEVDVTSITPGGAFLYDHWKRGDAVALLREKRPKFLVLQGQSIEPLSAPQSFSQSAALFKAEADRVGATTVLFETWAHPAGDPYYKDPKSGGSPAAMQAQLDSAYSALAKETGATLARLVSRGNRPNGLLRKFDYSMEPNIRPGPELISRPRCCFAQCSTFRRRDRVITVVCQKRPPFSCSGWQAKSQ